MELYLDIGRFYMPAIDVLGGQEAAALMQPDGQLTQPKHCVSSECMQY